MFNLVFAFIFCTLVIVMIFVHFTEYRNDLTSSRWMSASKINLWLTLGYVWFLNYLYCILRSRLSIEENILGAIGSLFFAAINVFVCYPRMSKVCQLFFGKRYSVIFILGIAAMALPYRIFLLVILLGFLEVMVEIRYLKRKKLS